MQDGVDGHRSAGLITCIPRGRHALARRDGLEDMLLLFVAPPEARPIAEDMVAPMSCVGEFE